MLIALWLTVGRVAYTLVHWTVLVGYRQDTPRCMTVL